MGLLPAASPCSGKGLGYCTAPLPCSYFYTLVAQEGSSKNETVPRNCRLGESGSSVPCIPAAGTSMWPRPHLAKQPCPLTAKPGADFPGCPLHPHPHPHPGAGRCLLQKPAAAASRPALASHVTRECSKKILVSLNNSDSSAVHVGSSVSGLSARREAAAEGGLRIDTSGRGGFDGAGPVLHAKHSSPRDGAQGSRCPPVPKRHPAREVGEDVVQPPPLEKQQGQRKREQQQSQPFFPADPWLEAEGCCFCCGARALHQSQRRATPAGLGSRAQVS